MQRVQDPTASATLIAPPTLSGPVGYFAPAVPGISAATRFRYWVATMYQEELMAILAAAGIAADTTGTVFNQVLLSIQALIAAAVGAIPHGVQSFTSTGTFTVPAGVTAVDVELWGAGSGSWASVSGIGGGGGAGGGYSRKRVSGLTPAGTVAVTVGVGGAAGTTAPLAPTAGAASSFGAYCSATGGTATNGTDTTSAPGFGNKAGVGSSGDLNLVGSDGGNAAGLFGGVGGAAAHGSGTNTTGNGVGVVGYFPGGGASGPVTVGGTTAQNGAAGGAGMCIVRW